MEEIFLWLMRTFFETIVVFYTERWLREGSRKPKKKIRKPRRKKHGK